MSTPHTTQRSRRSSSSALQACALIAVINSIATVSEGPLVSLVVVTHNAFPYVRRLLRSLRRTRGVAYEVVVVDNRSKPLLRAYLALQAIRGRIQRLRLLERHEGGATSYGFVKGGPVPRADGYCLLVDRELYLTYGLDERFEWFWGVTRLQAELLNAGHGVRAVREHDHLLYHFGGKSGDKTVTRRAKGMKGDRNDVAAWFAGHSVHVI